MRRLALTAAVAALLAGMSAASAETIAIVGGHIHTAGPSGNIESGTVVIRDGRIAAVGANVGVPQGARVIDAHGKIVTPGLIAADAGLGASEVGEDEDMDGSDTIDSMTAGPGDGTRDLSTQSKSITAAFDVQYALNPDSTVIPLARLAGITRAIVTPEYGSTPHGQQPREALFAGQAAVISLGRSTSLLVKPHAAMVVDLGQDGGDNAGGSRNAAIIELKDTLADVRSYMHNAAAYERNQTRAYALSKADLDALVPVVEGRMPLLVRAQRASDIRMALDIARSEKLKVILDGADEGWLVANEIAAAHVPVALCPTDDLPQDFERVHASMENAARLDAAGVEVIVANEAENYRIRELRYLAGDAVAYGLPWDSALKAVTINPARAFGFADRAGSLEPGKDADIVVWTGDPFEPLSQPAVVLIRGVEQPLTSRQLKLRDRYMDLHRDLPPQYH